VLYRSLALAAFVLVSASCKKPEPPQITPKEAKVTALGPAGVTMQVKVDALNPNAYELTAQSITAHAKIDGKYELGAVTVPEAITLPPNKPTEITASMTMPWGDVQTLASLMGTPGAIPYSIEGTAKIGGEKLNVDVPFAATGTITRDQIVGAAVKGLPPIPGLVLPK
jgi:hypothetical protein